jgi:hypothetical protein
VRSSISGGQKVSTLGFEKRPSQLGAVSEHEDWLHERHIDMLPEDGCLRVYSVGEDRPGLHRVWHRVPQAKSSPMLMCAVADGLIAMEKIPEVTTVLD